MQTDNMLAITHSYFNKTEHCKFTDVEESKFLTTPTISDISLPIPGNCQNFFQNSFLRHHEENFTHDKDVTYAQKALYAFSRIAS